MLLLWTICGFALGWWANVLFGARAPRRMQPRKAIEATTIAEVLQESRAGLIYERLTQAETPTAEAGQAERRPLRIFAFVVAALLILLLVIEPSWLVECPCVTGPFYVFKALLLSPRVLALLFGTVIGFWASRYREAIGARSGDFYEAFLGSETKSSWALQSVVAIVALLLLALAVEPDLLRNLESFKAGNVEWRFAGISSATRQAKIITNDLTKQPTLKQWVQFKTNYLDGSARDNALEFDESVIQEHRKVIRNALFEDYVEPLARLLDCLNEDHRLDRIRKNEDFVQLAIIFRNKILQEARTGGGAAFTLYDWIYLLESTDRQIRRAAEIIEAEIPKLVVQNKCKPVASNIASFADPEMKVQFLSDRAIRTQFDAMLLDREVIQAVAKLRTSQKEQSYTLSFFDPYLICAISDFIEITLGHTEKAAFLTQVKSFYPEDFEFIQPGLISLYYYLADSKQKSESSWALDEKLSELDFAMSGADHMIAVSRKRAAEMRRPVGKNQTTPVHKLAESAEDYDEIVDLYFGIKFRFLMQYLEIFCQHSLSGEVLPDRIHYRWARYYKQMESVLNVWDMSPSLDLEGVTGESTAVSDLSQWAKTTPPANIQIEVKFDAWVAMAQSAVMLTEQRNRASAQACTTGRFYLRQAKIVLPGMFKEDTSATSRLRGYLLQIEERVKASCPYDR